MTPPELRTERLVLRTWRPEDRAPFAALNADPHVMRYFPGTLHRSASDAFADRIEALMAEQGWGLWAVEVPDQAEAEAKAKAKAEAEAEAEAKAFIGFIGLMRQTFPAHFTPAIEIGWRLARPAWGRGYAPEGARAVLEHAFHDLGMDEIVSMTTTSNAPSRRVMEKIGMTHDPTEDFDHPNVPSGPLRRHVLYRIQR